MSIRAGELKECAEVDLEWSDAGAGPYTVRVVDSAALAANVGAAFKVWQGLETTSVKWEVDLSRDVPISVVVKPQQAQAKIYDIGTVQPGTCPPGTVLRGSKGSQSTMPNPEPTRAPEPAPGPATQTRQADPAPATTNQATPEPNPASSAHDDFPQFNTASRGETGRRPQDDQPTRASTQTGVDFPTSITTQGFPSISGDDVGATDQTGTRSRSDAREGTASTASNGSTGSSGQQDNAEPQHRSLGPVVGGVAGGIGAALLLGLLACYYLRRRGMRRRDELEDREYHVFTDTDSTTSGSHRRQGSRGRTRQSESGSQRSRRRAQEDREAYDEKCGYMEELGPTPRQSRYSDGLTTVQLNEMRGAVPELGQHAPRVPSLIHVDTESVRSMGVRHIIDPKELGRSPSSPKDGDSASVSVRGSIMSAFGASGAGSNANAVGEKRGRWRSSLSAFATSPMFPSFFGGRGVVPTPPDKGDRHSQKVHHEHFETLKDDERLAGFGHSRSVDSDRSDVSKKESDTVDARFTLTLPTAAERIMPMLMLPTEQEARSEQTHHTGSTSRTNTLQAASRKSTSTVKSVKSTKTGRSATTFGPDKSDQREKGRGRTSGNRKSIARPGVEDRSRERSESASSSGRQSRDRSVAHSPTSDAFEIPPLPTYRKSITTAPSSNDHRSSMSAKSVWSVSSRASKHVSGLAGLPALQYVDYGDSDDVPSVPTLPPMPFEDFGAAPSPQSVSTPTPSLFPAPPARPQPRLNTDLTGDAMPTGSSPSRLSPQSTRRASRSILSPLSQSRSRANSDATTHLTHDERVEEQSDNSCVTITARRVPVSAVGRVRSGMFERPRTLLMGSTSTTTSMFSQSSTSKSRQDGNRHIHTNSRRRSMMGPMRSQPWLGTRA